MMAEPLMVGTCGWEHAVWVDQFYPAELPEDWRFCYYSNNLRSVLVPGSILGTATRPPVTQWMEDSDPAFRFILELPPVLSSPLEHDQCERELDSFFQLVQPLLPRTAGLLWRLAPQTPVLLDWFEHLLNQLTRAEPLCVDLMSPAWRVPAVLAAVERQGAGVTWHCAREEAPPPGGKLMVAMAPVADARTVRGWIEKLAQWQGYRQDARSGLYFEPSGQSAKAAQEARLIAELMGV